MSTGDTSHIVPKLAYTKWALDLFSSCNIWYDMLWPNRLRHSLQESQVSKTGPSVDWDICELLA